MNEVISAVIRWVVPFILGGIITGCITYVRTKYKRNGALEDGVQCLLRGKIIDMHDKYIEREFCPVYAKESLRRSYAAYHALGGNDVATQLYKETMALPTEPPHNNQTNDRK